MAEQGTVPNRVLLSPAHYQLIQDYRRQLGELKQRENDYLDDFRIFDLEICIDDSGSPRVQLETEDGGEP